jgi:hypothetical protein
MAPIVAQIVVGKAHLIVARGLSESDPIVLHAAKTFFAMTIDSHIYSAQMHAVNFTTGRMARCRKNIAKPGG